ncbi:MAG TPA: hypothetical protein ENK62_07440 [Chromatiales bacterium]|nr:hypothetical protein [Chromatiales bacterium]
MKHLNTIMISAITAAAVHVLFLVARPPARAPEVVTVNFERLAEARARAMQGQARSQEQLIADAAQYGERLGRILTDIASRQGYVVLTHAAVAGGSRDITDIVLQQLSESEDR